MLTFRDVPISPYTGFHQGGPIWPGFAAQTWVRHCHGGHPIDVEPEPVTGDVEFLSGAYAWAGPVQGHFGHQLAEFGMRLVPTLQAEPQARFLFAPHHDSRTALSSMADVPGHLKDILGWFGVPLSRTRLVTTPAIVECLSIAPQAEQIGGCVGPDAAYLDWMDANVARHLGSQVSESAPVVYVSRSRMLSRFAGEAYVEGLLREAGVVVIHPEDLSLREQVAWYRRARTLIFPEGSAIHGLQLLGRIHTHVVVIRRTPQGLLNVPAILDPRGGSFEDLSFLRGHLAPRDPEGRLLAQLGIGVLDEGRWRETLVATLEDERLSGSLGRGWDPAAFKAAVSQDLAAWIGQIRLRGFVSAHHLDPVHDQLRSLGMPEVERALESRLPCSTVRHDSRVVQMLCHVREALPSGARVAVISRGDVRLLGLGKAHASHFPATPDGTYAGCHPEDDAEAIRMVEEQRSAGVEYLLIPRWEGWWLDHYVGFTRHLEGLTRTPVCRVDGGWLFRLPAPDAEGRPVPSSP